MKNGSPVSEKIIWAIGACFIMAGVILNEKILAAIFSADGAIAVPHRIVIGIIDILLIGLGLAVIIYRKRLTGEILSGIAGVLIILSGLLFNVRFLAILLDLEMSPLNKVIVGVFELYLIGTGVLFILLRKAFQLKNVLLYVFSSVLSLSLFLAYDCYTAYRFFSKDNRLHIYNVHVEDKYLGWKPKANSIGKHVYYSNFNVEYVIDENGYRKIKKPKEPVSSIYFFGDSFTFGQGVSDDDTFPSIIKRKYVKEDISVYNAGVLGYGIVQMFQRFLNMEDRIKSGDMIIFTPLSQDIERNMKDFYMPYLLSFFYEKLEYYPSYDNGVIRPCKLENNMFNLFKLLILKAPYTGNFWTAIYKKTIPDTTKEAIGIMDIIRERTEARGGKFYLFFLPNLEECLRGKYTNDISGFDHFDIMLYFPSKWKELEKIKFENDRHWNVRGHEIAARAIVKTLIDKGALERQDLRQKGIDSGSFSYY
ncbi:MAG: SGNH/GDSL hydrolase family protein [Nitrospirae bacterium]|nr:SGNH/GDSL hydrolase family protein [Nitrospirota bacterium]